MPLRRWPDKSRAIRGGPGALFAAQGPMAPSFFSDERGKGWRARWTARRWGHGLPRERDRKQVAGLETVLAGEGSRQVVLWEIRAMRLFSLAVLAALAPSSVSAAEARRPNILWICGDDHA